MDDGLELAAGHARDYRNTFGPFLQQILSTSEFDRSAPGGTSYKHKDENNDDRMPPIPTLKKVSSLLGTQSERTREKALLGMKSINTPAGSSA